MKKSFLVLLCLISGWAQAASQGTVAEIKGALTLKTTDGKTLIINNDNKDKIALEILVRPSKIISRSVLNRVYEIVIKSDAQEAVFETMQKRTNVDPDKPTSRIALKYFEAQTKTKQDYSIDCALNEEDISVIEKSTEPKSMECIKREGCKSYVLGDGKTFELKESPICIGKQKATVTKKKVKQSISCLIVDKDDANEAKNGARLVYATEAEAIETSSDEACK